MPTSSIGDALTTMSSIRAGLGESTTRETWTHGIRTKFVLPLLQSFGLGLCLFLMCLCAWGVVYCLLLGTGQLFWMVFGSLACACFGAGWAIGAWNLGKELTDTFWRKSPGESVILPSAANLLDHMAGEHEERVPRIIPYHVNNETLATSAAPANPVPLAREDARLLDFLTIAMTRHIDAPTRRKMRADDGMQHFTLSQCKESLNREAYEAIMADLTQWGFVAVAKGTGATWAVPPAEAYRTLAAEVERRRG